MDDRCYPLQAQPLGFEQLAFLAMQVSPQALPFLQVLQQPAPSALAAQSGDAAEIGVSAASASAANAVLIMGSS